MTVEFTEPMRPDDTLSVSMTVAEKWPLDDETSRGQVNLEFAVTNQDRKRVFHNLATELVSRREGD